MMDANDVVERTSLYRSTRRRLDCGGRLAGRRRIDSSVALVALGGRLKENTETHRCCTMSLTEQKNRPHEVCDECFTTRCADRE